MKHWVFSPHSGGQIIPTVVQGRVTRRVLTQAARHGESAFGTVEVSFRGKFCYIDAFQEPALPTKAVLTARRETKEHYLQRLRSTPIHLCRLRYFAEDKWSIALYLYSHERYEPSVYVTGEYFGTPEEAIDLCATFCLP